MIKSKSNVCTCANTEVIECAVCGGMIYRNDKVQENLTRAHMDCAKYLAKIASLKTVSKEQVKLIELLALALQSGKPKGGAGDARVDDVNYMKWADALIAYKKWKEAK